VEFITLPEDIIAFAYSSDNQRKFNGSFIDISLS